MFTDTVTQTEIIPPMLNSTLDIVVGLFDCKGSEKLIDI